VLYRSQPNLGSDTGVERPCHAGIRTAGYTGGELLSLIVGQACGRGDTTIATGVSKIVAVVVCENPSAAVTVTVCALVTSVGAVYNPPADMVPTAGLIDQVTATGEPPYVAEYWDVCPAWSETLAGELEILRP